MTGASVTFGGVPATSVAVLDSNGIRIRAVTPSHGAGTVDVVVTNPDGRSATLPGGFAFVAPVRVSPQPRVPRTVTPRP
jgi:hypothetical protein